METAASINLQSRFRDTPKRLLADIEALEQRAHRLTMTYTAQAMNNAKNTCGWELAGQHDRAIKAMRGDR